MKKSRSPRQPPSSAVNAEPSYPLPSYLNFVPGGLEYHASHLQQNQHWHAISQYSPPFSPSPSIAADALLRKAYAADATLRSFSLHSAAAEAKRSEKPEVPHYLPSLSLLAEAVFGPLTGVQSTVVKKWADAMVLTYLDDNEEANNETQSQHEPFSDDDASNWEQNYTPCISSSATSKKPSAELIPILRSLHEKHLKLASTNGDSKISILPRRLCGYVFRRGDIAWNCRTCQSDSTCVLCDACFHDSDHEGHEVFFHRTSPGGCCDCGDVEAWKVEGCCSRHRPLPSSDANSSKENNTMEVSRVGSVTTVDGDDKYDDFEAVRASQRGRADGERAVEEMLPPRLTAALGVVIGAAVQAVVRAVDGAGIGSDPIQWTRRWADQVRRVRDGKPHDEDYMTTTNDFNSCASSSLAAMSLPFPNKFRLHIRLHNDDVHTFDEVIEALHTGHLWSRRNASAATGEDLDDETDTAHGLVENQDAATEMTQHVDSDGQVTVRSYATFDGAKAGYDRLKSKGLHCSVVSSAQVDLELKARLLLAWLGDVSGAHPAVASLVVHALVDVTEGKDTLGGVHVWSNARLIPPWSYVEDDHKDNGNASANKPGWKRRFEVFPPHLPTSYLTRDEAARLHQVGLGASAGASSSLNAADFVERTGANLSFYSKIPYRLPNERYRKSPHALWGTMPPPFVNNNEPLHPVLQHRYAMRGGNNLSDYLLVIDTDLRKQQEADKLTTLLYPHKLLGLHIISGVGLVQEEKSSGVAAPTPEEWRHLLSTSSFRAPFSPLLLFLLLDPYPPKQLRSSMHALFFSLFVDSRFKCRFAASLGGIAYRPLSTLFCAGIGTDGDTPLGFTVQIFTAGSLVRALGNADATKKLLSCDASEDVCRRGNNAGVVFEDVYTTPIAHTVVRCIHTNLLGTTKEVKMVLKNTAAGNSDDVGNSPRSDALLSALTYQQGEHPSTTILPAAPDDGFLDSRSTRHKRLPHLLRDLEYIFETPGTALRLLQHSPDNIWSKPSFVNAPCTIESFDLKDLLCFSTVWSRLLRLAQGIDPQKRKISGGHIEYEQNRWLEAFGLSLNFTGARDALAESLFSSLPHVGPPSFEITREATRNLFTALLREIKMWLYRDSLLETGLPFAAGSGPLGDLGQLEALQRSTLHVSSSHLGLASDEDGMSGSVNAVALSCATGVKMTEAQLSLIENALLIEQSKYDASCRGAMMGDWLRVPHSPLAGDCLSFHLPLHRALARSIRSICSFIVPDSVRNLNPYGWWTLPVLDDFEKASGIEGAVQKTPLSTLLKPTLRSSNCRIVWSSGPDCTSAEAQLRRSRSRMISSFIASAKVIHSLCDHPLRCLAAAQQIERHLWTRNGSGAAGMALNYGSAPLCRSFRDLDLTMVQFSAAGFSLGLGARRVFALLLSRFSMDGYLCDPERRGGTSGLGSVNGGTGSPNSGGYGNAGWVNPPRLQDPEHAIALSESFFTTVCLLVTELPSPPPLFPSDDSALRKNVRRELLHALAAEPRSHSEAMAAASGAVTRRDDCDGSSSGNGGGAASFHLIFADVLRDIGRQKNQGQRVIGAPTFELKPECSDEYDPTFFHLRRHEHQHAMDSIAQLRKQKLAGDKGNAMTAKCLPIVCSPPVAHPRFMSCRLLLHLPQMDAALRRALLFALSGGRWLPPEEPALGDSDEELDHGLRSVSAHGGELAMPRRIQVAAFGRRTFNRTASGPMNSRSSKSNSQPFSPAIVAASSVSFLEVLQILTLQIHTLEDCALLHRAQSYLDHEARSLSAGLSINSYLGRLIYVPPSLVNVWSLNPYPDGPLPSKGTGSHRGSILGLLVALYEHRSDHGRAAGKGANVGHGDDGHGGARGLAADGLKWILRFVNALVNGAASVGAACKSAINGAPVRAGDKGSRELDRTSWSIDPEVRSNVCGMLKNLADLWPAAADSNDPGDDGDAMSAKNREARKAKQMLVMERMKKQQASFAASIAKDTSVRSLAGKENEKEETDLCIICRCDDADGENNGPLGFLGHVQRSRALHLRSLKECGSLVDNELHRTYRVVGDKGCQVRATEAMDSSPLACLPLGSVVTILESKVSPKYDLLSRRVLVRHASLPDGKITEGWASIQSSDGYVILSPLISLCYSNSRWGSTRPIIRQCGHAAHLKCVETHCLSLHQRAVGDQPYDGRFAANIEDGEFLCPLCKQLSNVLLPRDGYNRIFNNNSKSQISCSLPYSSPPNDSVPSMNKQLTSLRTILVNRSRALSDELDEGRTKATKQFGAHLLQAMQTSWENNADKKKQKKWHPALRRWDFEEEKSDNLFSTDYSSSLNPCVGSILRLLRQQHIAWAAAGHSAAAAEASCRGIRQIGLDPPTTDPWIDYDTASRDSHPMLLELMRTITATAGLLEVLCAEMSKQLTNDVINSTSGPVTLVGCLLANILEGRFWTSFDVDSHFSHAQQWSVLTALLSAIPCHISRDGMLSLRHEARATAAAMWAMKTLGSQAPDEGSFNTPYVTSYLKKPPVPLCIRQLPYSERILRKSCGTMNPFNISEGSSWMPFLPAVASAFLYIPLLAWDLNTLAGAVFSTLLSNDVAGERAGGADLMFAARMLIIGRLVQILITPDGFDESFCNEGVDLSSDSNYAKDSQALVGLMKHCRETVNFKSKTPSYGIDDSEKLMSAISTAILPFGRSLILLLRACTSALRQRRLRLELAREKESTTSLDRVLEELLENEEPMFVEDGFFVLQAMGGPMPAEIMTTFFEEKNEQDSSWFQLINRWLKAIVGLEAFHGSRGEGLRFDGRTGKAIFASSETVIEASKTAQKRKGESSNTDRYENSVEKENQATGMLLSVEPTSLNDLSEDGERNESVDMDDVLSIVNDENVVVGDWNSDSDEDMNDDGVEVRNWEATEGNGLTMNINIGLLNLDRALQADDDASFNDAEMENVEGGEETIDFEEIAMGATRRGAAQLETEASNELDESIDGDHISDTSSPRTDSTSNDCAYAGVSRSAIISYQPSLLGVQSIGPGPRGKAFDFSSANAVMRDLSHLGMIHRSGLSSGELIRLPRSFVELYSLVNRVKGCDNTGVLDDNDDGSSSETAICLLTGTIMRSGSPRRSFHRSLRPPGLCTIHARKFGSGIGVFFLVQKCTVLLMHNNKSAYSASLYVDEHGEEDPGLRRGRPLFLKEERYGALETLWRQHGIPREVAQIRSTSDRVIRDNWY